MNNLTHQRVLLVDDHPFIRQALRTFLTIIFKNLDIVGEADNGCDAVRLCGELSPTMVLMDIVMPCLNGIEATSLILEDHPGIKVIGLTSLDENDGLVQQLLDAGAVGCLNKQAGTDEMIKVFQRCDIRSHLHTNVR